MLELKRMMSNPAYRSQMQKAYDEVRKVFSEKHASDRVSDMVMEMAGWKK